MVHSFKQNLHARRHRTNQARNCALFDSTRVGAQAASCALQDLAGRPRYVQLEIHLFRSGQEIKAAIRHNGREIFVS